MGGDIARDLRRAGSYTTVSICLLVGEEAKDSRVNAPGRPTMMNLPVAGNSTELFAEPSQRDLGGAGRELPTETIVARDFRC